MTTDTPHATRLPTGLYIDGTWISSSTGGVMDHVNAASGKVQSTFPIAGAAEINDAVASARAALPAWRATPTPQRAVILREIDRLLRERDHELALISTLQNSIIAPKAPSATRQTGMFEYYGALADALQGDLFPRPHSLEYTTPEPYGVIARISPWNGPGFGISLAAALAAGNTAILKPSELAPFTALWFADLACEAGLPPGVLNVVPAAAEGSSRLVAHPGIDKISFTGSGRVAAAIQAASAPNLTPLQLELGGKSASIVFADADLDQAAVWTARRLCFMAGQACIAPSRLLVQETVYDQVIEKVAETMRGIRVGDPLEPGTQMGPVITAAALERITGLISRHTAAHAAPLAGGTRLGGELADGFFLPPTLVTDPDGSAEISSEEVFGPVLTVTPFKTEDEAVALTNATPYGLAAYAFTTDLPRIGRLTAAIDAGNVSVNGGEVIVRPYSPFGGFKDSGYGTEGGIAGLMEFVRFKHVNLSLAGQGRP